MGLLGSIDDREPDVSKSGSIKADHPAMVRAAMPNQVEGAFARFDVLIRDRILGIEDDDSTH